MKQYTFEEIFNAKEPLKNESKETCKSCAHRQPIQCGGRVIQYCGVRKSNRTDSGRLKIKCKTKACLLFTVCEK